MTTAAQEALTVPESALVFDNLSFRDQLSVYWGFFWRSLVMSVVALIAASVLGFIVGLFLYPVAVALGWTPEGLRTTARSLGFAIGFIVGLLAYWQFIRWLFFSSWRGYRLRLVRFY